MPPPARAGGQRVRWDCGLRETHTQNPRQDLLQLDERKRFGDKGLHLIDPMAPVLLEVLVHHGHHDNRGGREVGIGTKRKKDLAFDEAAKKFLDWTTADKKPNTRRIYAACLAERSLGSS